MKILAVLPHFEPDVAPTGVIASRLVEELGGLGHHVDVVTSLPWPSSHSERLPGPSMRHETMRWPAAGLGVSRTS